MDRLYETFPSLEQGDIENRSMGAQGADLILSPRAQRLFPYGIECKARKSTKTLYDWIAQAESNTKDGQTPLVVFKGDRKPAQVILPLDHFLHLVRIWRAD